MRKKRRYRKSGVNKIALTVVLLVAVAGAAALWWFYGGGSALIPLAGEGNSQSQGNDSVAAAGEPDASPTPEPTAEPTPAPTPTPTPEPTAPPIYDDGTDGYLSGGVCIYNNKAFELFYGGEDSAAAYANVISSLADQLTGIRVYNMVVPNHSEFGLPERIRDSYGCSSQRENISAIYSGLSSSVTAVDVYDALNLHNNEPIYYNTDTHWSSLGAYYAYAAFGEAAGVETASLEEFTKTSYPGFVGYLYDVTGEDCLTENPDTIDVYDPAFSYTCEISYDGSEYYEAESMNAHDASAGYTMFFHGDNGCVRVKNSGLSTGRKLVMVKDSYGNALAPFLTASFDEVHVVDFRYFTSNLKDYMEENGITDLLFFNNAMTANTYDRQQEISTLFE